MTEDVKSHIIDKNPNILKRFHGPLGREKLSRLRNVVTSARYCDGLRFEVDSFLIFIRIVKYTEIRVVIILIIM